ncbi:MAG: dihydrofolate reductase family protein [Thermoplasmatota archaeon]
MATQFYTASTLNGFLATKEDSLDWLFSLESGTPDDGGLANTSYPEFIAQVGAIAMGSATYEWMLRNADALVAETGSAWPYSQPTWVFTTRTLEVPAGADVRFAQGDVRDVHADMVDAAAGRNVWIVGGGDLAGQFLDAGLLDELIVQVASVTLAEGKPLLPRDALSPMLKLQSASVVGKHMVELRYTINS